MNWQILSEFLGSNSSKAHGLEVLDSHPVLIGKMRVIVQGGIAPTADHDNQNNAAPLKLCSTPVPTRICLTRAEVPCLRSN